MFVGHDFKGQAVEVKEEQFATIQAAADLNFLAVVDKLCEVSRQVGREEELRKRVEFLEQNWMAPDDYDELHEKIEELTKERDHQAGTLDLQLGKISTLQKNLESYGEQITQLKEEKGELLGKLALQGKANSAPIPLEVGDTISIEKAGGGTREWVIQSIVLGAARQEDVATLAVCDRQPSDEGLLLVPLDLIRAAMRGRGGDLVSEIFAEANPVQDAEAEDAVAGQEAETPA